MQELFPEDELDNEDRETIGSSLTKCRKDPPKTCRCSLVICFVGEILNRLSSI